MKCIENIFYLLFSAESDQKNICIFSCECPFNPNAADDCNRGQCLRVIEFSVACFCCVQLNDNYINSAEVKILNSTRISWSLYFYIADFTFLMWNNAIILFCDTYSDYVASY